MSDSSARRRRRLHDILTYADSINRITAPLARATFEADEIAQKAVCFDLLCISEATARLLDLDPSVADRHPRVPWAQVRAIGNLLRHEYAGIDIGIIWETVAAGDLGALTTAVSAELENAT
ncbi:MAG TPA: HepT-like ribonuclease domain-containing protein [Candidatus Limnocylindrales bacterium]|nr:HepT-like ribonuclease domain-containing protein [Candidatus Limnocylindrales bacterium]